MTRDIMNWREERTQKPDWWRWWWCQQGCAASWVLNWESQSRCPCCGRGCLLGNWETDTTAGWSEIALCCCTSLCSCCCWIGHDVFLGVSLRQRRVHTCRAGGRKSKPAKWTEGSRGKSLQKAEVCFIDTKVKFAGCEMSFYPLAVDCTFPAAHRAVCARPTASLLWCTQKIKVAPCYFLKIAPFFYPTLITEGGKRAKLQHLTCPCGLFLTFFLPFLCELLYFSLYF